MTNQQPNYRKTEKVNEKPIWRKQKFGGINYDMGNRY